MKKGVEIKINLSNRAIYTLIVIGILAIVGVGVWAYTGNVGHTSDEIDETDPTVLDSVKNGVSWDEITGIPSGFVDGVDNTGESDVKIKVIEMGSWNIMSKNQLEMPLSQISLDISKIRGISAIVRNDDGTFIDNAGELSEDLSIKIKDNKIVLHTYNGGRYDNSDYNRFALYNRGWITIIYEE